MHAFAYGARRVKGHTKAGFALLFALVVVATGVSAFAGGGYAPSDVGTMSTTYGGRAYGVSTSIPLIGDTTYADTGDLPASGGALFADFTPVGDSVASATVFLSYTRGFLVAGRSEVSVPDTGEPNQIYSIPGVLTLVINEQIGGTHDMTVNALHLTTVAGVEAVVADARSMVDCSGGGLPTFGLSASSVGTGVTPMWGVPPKDFMTGGGFFFANLWSTSVGDRVNFGFNAGPRPGTWSPDPPFGIKGHLNLIDHGPFCAVRHVEGTDVTD